MDDPSNRIAAILFDFDGVILESTAIKTQAFSDLFKNYPRRRKQIVRYHERNAGISRFKKFDYIYRNILREPLTDIKKEELGVSFAKLIRKKILAAKFVPGAIDFLRRNHKKRDLLVVSGTPQPELLNIVKARGLKKFFKGVYGSPQTKDVLIRMIFEKKRLPPRRTVYVGDAHGDYLAAKKNKVPFVLRVSGGSSRTVADAKVRVRNLKTLESALRRAVGNS